MSTKASTAVGAVVAIMIVGAVAILGYYQVVVAPNQTSSTTTTTPSVTCPSAQCVNVNMTNGASIPPPGYTGGATTYGFAPDSITVILGTNSTIFFSNGDVAIHTATSTNIPTGATPFDSGLVQAGGTYQVTLTVPGTYSYHCSIHAWMQGKIIVLAGSSTGTTSSSTHQ